MRASIKALVQLGAQKFEWESLEALKVPKKGFVHIMVPLLLQWGVVWVG